MTRREFFRLIEIIQAQDRELLEKKNHDYAGDEDALENLREIGFHGIVTRIRDKVVRLKVFDERREKGNSGPLSVQDETIADTLADIANFCVLGRIMLAEEKKWPLARQ